MNRMQLNSPFLLGFDHLERLLDKAGKASESYPPYNIEHDEHRITITLAVAGFAPSDLSVTIENNQLVIRGRQEEDTAKSFLHRGIASRQFQKSFVIADGVEVLSAELRQGLLSIELENRRKALAVKTVPIRSAEIHLGAANVILK